MSERLMFTPSLGFVIVIAWLLSTKVAASKHKDLIVFAILLMCLFKTHARNGAWKNDFTLFTTDAKTSKNSIKGNLAAAVTFLEESHSASDTESFRQYRASALEHSKRAVSLYEKHVDLSRLESPSYSHAIMLLGDCYGANEMLTEALQCYKRILSSIPNRDQLCETVETAISKSNDANFKIKNYLEFVALVPDSFIFNYRLGYLFGKEKNDLAKSIFYLEKAVELRPDETHALEALSHAYKLSQNYEKAASTLEKVTAANPGDLSNAKKLLAIYKLAGDQAKISETMQRIEQLEGPLPPSN